MAEIGSDKYREKEARIANSQQDFFCHVAHQILKFGCWEICKKLSQKSTPVTNICKLIINITKAHLNEYINK